MVVIDMKYSLKHKRGIYGLPFKYDTKVMFFTTMGVSGRCFNTRINNLYSRGHKEMIDVIYFVPRGPTCQ